ncbi:MAG: hypothetical protein COB53_07125 [Elusimicrobia bacterium]|nr:MAG: hypothetical protein COB53_07125 [Elusimicrobiota bacterium]
MNSKSRIAGSTTRIISGLLSFAIWVSSFAPAAASAAPVIGKTGKIGVQAPTTLIIPAITTPVLGDAALVILPGLQTGVLPTLTPTVLPSLNAPAVVTAAAQPKTVSAQVAQVVKQLGKVEGSSAQAHVLNGLYLGGLNAADDNTDGVDASGGAPSRNNNLKQTASLTEVAAAAMDSKSTLATRKAAVQDLAESKQDGAKQALTIVAGANRDGDADDYEVHRAALRALDSVYGELHSLRPISQQHKKEILAELSLDKPEMVLSDYDGTLADTKADISPEMAEAIASVPNAGIEFTLLTDRPAAPRYEGDITIFQSLAPMTPAQKSRLTVLSDIGDKTSIFNKDGSPQLLHEDKSEWSAADLATLAKASKALLARFGPQDFLGNDEVYDVDSFERFLPKNLSAAEIAEAGAITQAALKEGGLTDAHIVARRPFGADEVPYVRVSMRNKSVAAASIRKDARLLERARDIIRFGGGGRTLRFFKKIFSRFPPRPIAARNTIVIGDSFMPETVAPGSDALMAKGAPGAKVFAVGATASPRLDNVFVWPTLAEAASLEILGALGEKPISGVDKKGVAGLFAQRTLAIATFILTTIAFTAIAVPAIGWVGYGVVMATGALAPIAVGPLNGWIVDKLSARNSMMFNQSARVLLDFLPPALVLLGMVNTPMLIIAAIANFWVLSSVMTTEGAYIKRLAGKKYVGPINSLLWMNYLIVQVVLALILGFGAVVGIVGPINAYFIAAGINAFIIMPIVWYTMPNAKPIPKTLLGLEAEIASLKKEDTTRLTTLRKALMERESALGNEVDQLELSIDELTQELQEVSNSDRRAGIETELRVNRENLGESLTELLRSPTRTLTLSQRRVFLHRKIEGRLKQYGVGAGLLAASVLSYFFLWASPIPIALALGYLVLRTDGAKLLWSGRGRDISKRETELVAKIRTLEAANNADSSELNEAKKELERWKKSPRIAMIYIALGALTLGPLQSFAIPRFTEAVTGLPMASPESSLLFGQYLGAMFFGSLIANAAQVRLPEVRVPILGRIAGQRFVQGIVAMLAPIWAYTSLVPGSILAAVSALIAAGVLMRMAATLTNRAWMKILGLGMAGIWLPYLAWGSAFLTPGTAMFLSVLLAGMVYGPAFVSLKTIFEGSLQKSLLGKMIGVQGSLLSTARAIAIGGTAAIYGALNPAFPSFLAALGIFYALIGIAFWISPRFFPSLPKTFLRHDNRRR